MIPFQNMGHINSDPARSAVRQLALWAMESRKDASVAVIVEIGAWAGESSILMADARLPQHPAPRPIVFAVDHWLGNPDHLGRYADEHGPIEVFQTFCRNVGPRLFRSIVPLYGPSAFWASVWPDSLPIDLAYIDADHSYEMVKQDIGLWRPHIRTGGILAGHDYEPIGWPGVVKAVHETLGDDVSLTEGGTVWYKRMA